MAQKGSDGAGSGDVIGPATNTDSYIPQWDGADSKTLKNGLAATNLASIAGLTPASSLIIGNGAGAFTVITPASFITTNNIVTSGDDVTSQVNAATTSAAGKVELAEASEVTTGTSTSLAVTPDAFAGSVYGKRIIEVKVFDDATELATGDGKAIICIPSELNGYNLVDADAFVTTVSSSGTPTIQIRNVTDSHDMLSTEITIDASEYTSYTAATAPVINTSYDDVATGDIIAIDVDGAGTGAKGLGVILTFQLP